MSFDSTLIVPLLDRGFVFMTHFCISSQSCLNKKRRMALKVWKTYLKLPKAAELSIKNLIHHPEQWVHFCVLEKWLCSQSHKGVSFILSLLRHISSPSTLHSLLSLLPAVLHPQKSLILITIPEKTQSNTTPPVSPLHPPHVYVWLLFKKVIIISSLASKVF